MELDLYKLGCDRLGANHTSLADGYKSIKWTNIPRGVIRPVRIKLQERNMSIMPYGMTLGSKEDLTMEFWIKMLGVV